MRAGAEAGRGVGFGDGGGVVGDGILVVGSFVWGLGGSNWRFLSRLERE